MAELLRLRLTPSILLLLLLLLMMIILYSALRGPKSHNNNHQIIIITWDGDKRKRIFIEFSAISHLVFGSFWNTCCWCLAVDLSRISAFRDTTLLSIVPMKQHDWVTWLNDNKTPSITTEHKYNETLWKFRLVFFDGANASTELNWKLKPKLPHNKAQRKTFITFFALAEQNILKLINWLNVECWW